MEAHAGKAQPSDTVGAKKKTCDQVSRDSGQPDLFDQPRHQKPSDQGQRDTKKKIFHNNTTFLMAVVGRNWQT